MKVQIASDLHLEFPENKKWIRAHPLVPKADLLIIAGDVIPDKFSKEAEFFYKKIRKDFKFIIQIPGNHEYYHGNISYAYPDYSEKLSENHLKANNKAIVFGGVKFILSTLWSYVPDESYQIIKLFLNDYHVIYCKRGIENIPLSPYTTNNYYHYSLEFIKKELKKEFDGKIVLVTHHLPSFKCISEKFKDYELNCAYASELEPLIKKNPKIKLWIHGHSHDFQSVNIGKTKVIRNPVGYVKQQEEKDFIRDFVIDV